MGRINGPVVTIRIMTRGKNKLEKKPFRRWFGTGNNLLMLQGKT